MISPELAIRVTHPSSPPILAVSAVGVGARAGKAEEREATMEEELEYPAIRNYPLSGSKDMASPRSFCVPPKQAVRVATSESSSVTVPNQMSSLAR